MVSRHAKKIADARQRELARLAALSADRLEETVASLNARLVTATQDAAQQGLLREHAEDMASVAQELLAVVSHDLRNPLNSIVLSAEVLLAQNPADQTMHKSVNRINASALSAMRLINDLLDYSQARVAGRIRIFREEANIHELAQSAVDELEFAQRGHTVHVRAEGDGIGLVDANRMTQVLLNLISNAFTHSPDSSDVDVATQTDNGRIVIRIHNANRFGPIPSELLPVLFLPFKSGSARSGSPTRSIGLGLYIVDQIVKAHGGRVDVDSADAATTFTVTIDR
jgi:signal transduction histidine kinase